MQTEYYSPAVTFEDPMTSLSGVQSYQDNVDMLASRTLMGKLFFQDARIILHQITGGDVVVDGDDDGPVEPKKGDTMRKPPGIRIQPITTRWTLKLTVTILPWKPTATFSGISVYNLIPVDKQPMVQIIKQTDYWDAINILPMSQGQYHKVPSSLAVGHFLQQLAPRGPASQAAGQVEVPYTLLRKGNGYDVRSYPAMTVVSLPYTRREEGYDLLGSFIQKSRATSLSPLVLEVDTSQSLKIMSWPVSYALPNESEESVVSVYPLAGTSLWENVSVRRIPPSIVAIGAFQDASVEPVVRRMDQELRKALERDGLVPKDISSTTLRFAQYDAVFSMGTRRGEVWIDLAEDGHPW
jgi:hypothetical protein